MWAQIVLFGLSATVALGNGIGPCPTPKLQEDFDLEKFAGTWYLLEQTASLDKFTKKCSNYVIEKKQGLKASLLHKFISTFTDKWKSEFSEITTPKKTELAKLLISPLKGTVMAKKSDLFVVDTDYEEYAILYSCKKLLLTHTDEIFIVSRNKKLDDKKKTELYETLRKRELNQKSLVEVNQAEKDCKE